MTVDASPKVIFDNGNTRPLPVQPGRTFSPYNRTPSASPTPEKNPLLPIRTPELSVGRVTRRKTPATPYMVRPTCVIGADPDSLNWLQHNKKQLIAINAYCWLVQADTADDLKRVADVAEGLTVIPVPGTILSQAFGIHHYPVLISAQLIEQ